MSDWVFLTDDVREKIARASSPYVADSYAPHEAEVLRQNPRENWQGLSPEERKEIVNATVKPFYMKHLFAAIEAKLKEKNQ